MPFRNGSEQRRRATVILSDIRRISPRLQVRFLKTKALSRPLGDSWEPALETFEIPLDSFRPEADEFDAGAIKKISLIFDQTVRGMVIIDEIGFSLMEAPSAF